MRRNETNGKDEAAVIALQALGWVLADERRADRLLAMTGLDPESLRAGIGDPAVLAALLGFLEDHETDLIGCAEAIGHPPGALVTARQALTA